MGGGWASNRIIPRLKHFTELQWKVQDIVGLISTFAVFSIEYVHHNEPRLISISKARYPNWERKRLVCLADLLKTDDRREL